MMAKKLGVAQDAPSPNGKDGSRPTSATNLPALANVVTSAMGQRKRKKSTVLQLFKRKYGEHNHNVTVKRKIRRVFWVCMAIARMKNSSKVELSSHEVQTCQIFFERLTALIAGNRSTTTNHLHSILAEMGNTMTFDELDEILRQVHFVERELMTFEMFLKVLQVLKKRWKDDRVAETAEAFNALGGNRDGTGQVMKQQLQEAVDLFGLPLDVDAFIAEADEDGSGEIDYNEFLMLFPQARSEKAPEHYARKAALQQLNSQVQEKLQEFALFENEPEKEDPGPSHTMILANRRKQRKKEREARLPKQSPAMRSINRRISQVATGSGNVPKSYGKAPNLENHSHNVHFSGKRKVVFAELNPAPLVAMRYIEWKRRQDHCQGSAGGVAMTRKTEALDIYQKHYGELIDSFKEATKPRPPIASSSPIPVKETSPWFLPDPLSSKKHQGKSMLLLPDEVRNARSGLAKRSTATTPGYQKFSSMKQANRKYQLSSRDANQKTLSPFPDLQQDHLTRAAGLASLALNTLNELQVVTESTRRRDALLQQLRDPLTRPHTVPLPSSGQGDLFEEGVEPPRAGTPFSAPGAW